VAIEVTIEKSKFESRVNGANDSTSQEIERDSGEGLSSVPNSEHFTLPGFTLELNPKRSAHRAGDVPAEGKPRREIPRLLAFMSGRLPEEVHPQVAWSWLTMVPGPGILGLGEVREVTIEYY
jgi:hypothetical protein